MRRPEPHILRLVIFIGALVAVLVLLIWFRSIFLPLLVGLGIAYVLDPAVSFFERRGRSRVFGVVIITLLMVLAVAGMLLYVIPEILDQLHALADRLPQYVERVHTQLQPLMERLRARYPEQIAEAQQRGLESLRAALPQVATGVTRFLAGFFNSAVDVLMFIVNMVFIPVFAFYLLVDFPRLKESLRGLIPIPYEPTVMARMREVDGAVASFLRGQLIIAVILATINATGLMIIGVPLGLLIGIVAGLANMIPYMALVVGLVPALLLCWVEHGSLLRLVAVVAVFSGAQMLEGTVLSPRILGKSVNLHPVWVLLAVIVGGSLFGFIGLLLAVPVAAAIQVFARHWVATYKHSTVYRGPRVLEAETPPPR